MMTLVEILAHDEINVISLGKGTYFFVYLQGLYHGLFDSFPNVTHMLVHKKKKRPAICVTGLA